MDWLAWIFLYAVALVVFQVLVYRYLWTREEPFERTTPQARPNGDGDAVDDSGRRDHVRTDASTGLWVNPQSVSTLSERHCPHCGEENEPDPAYTFCWNCAGRLA
ncbi:hypothetical protein SAMN04487948_12450 [Halogranum amylolyticum]|uniref:DUF7577 domain-containing protein n=1 Tax=Halogranum amylolyticum TaxID=660520 RepID=A0A1H8W6N2_9EURY|nr:hypothetical protein [Halogranum amylolyticum]SEP23311.1 hypothetical protein SAMN04487948_12450 [Halogranum amylolyticum]